MVNIDRVRVSWTGFPGAPGVSTFYFTAAPPHLTALQNVYGNCANLFPADVTIRVEGSGDTIDPLTGLIVGQWTGTAPAVVTGTYTGGYSAASGGLIRWNTGTVLSGRRLRGRTFLVPLAGIAYQNDGTISDSQLGIIQGAANGLVAAATGVFVVHNRPRAASPAWTDVHGRLHPAVTSRAGGFSAVTSALAIDKSVVLRSRRD